MLSDENSMLNFLGNFCHFFYQAKHTALQRQHQTRSPSYFQLKSPAKASTEARQSPQYLHTTTHMESYYEDSILLKVIKALHYLANIYSALMTREQKYETHMDPALKVIMFFCLRRKLVPCEILIKIPNPYICIMLQFPQ